MFREEKAGGAFALNVAAAPGRWSLITGARPATHSCCGNRLLPPGSDRMELLLLPIFFLLAILVSVLAFALWIWAIVDCAMNEPSEGNTKVVWILIIVFTHWVGALLYLIVQRPRRVREEREHLSSLRPPGRIRERGAGEAPPPV